MNPTARYLLLAAAAIVAIAGGTAAYFTLVKPPPTPPPQQTTPPATPPPPAPATASVDTLPIVRSFSVVRDTAAYADPDAASPRLYTLPAGYPLCSFGITPDGKWVGAMTADSHTAWLLAEYLGPFDASAIPHGALPDSLSGTPEVVNTGALEVDQQPVTLAGLSGLAGDFTSEMKKTIAMNGNHVDCERHGTGYRCKLPNGTDLGRVALYNGIAVDSGCATADYLQQEDAARAAPRGIWK